MRLAPLLLIIVLVPILELALLIRVGQAIGVWPTLAIVIGTAIVGAAVLRARGISIITRVLDALEEGRTPIPPAIDGFLFVVAGVLLITPGPLADSIGLILLVPAARQLLGQWGVRRLADSGWVRPRVSRRQRPARPVSGDRWTEPSGEGPVIEGEFRRLDERPADSDPRDKH
jgi:UPF0716 protein FxsA